MTPPISIDGTDITGATIDGQDVEEITVDGDTVFSAGPGGVAPGATLLAHYPLNSGSGTTAADTTGNEVDITLESGASFVSDSDGIGGFSVDCDGNDDFLKLDPEPSFTTSSYTVMFTLDLDAANTGQTFYNAAGDLFQAFGIGRDSPAIVADGSAGGNRQSIEAFTGPTTSRTRYGVEFNNSSQPQAIYIDGADDTDGNISTNFAFNTGSVPVNFMRAGNDKAYTDGKIDNIVFYDGTLTSAEVTADYQAQPWS